MRTLRPSTLLFGPCSLLAIALLFLGMGAAAVQFAAPPAPEALGLLIERSAADPDAQARQRAIVQLSARSEVEVTGALECALQDGDASVRAAAIHALRSRPAGRRLLELAAACDADPGNRERALAMLGR